LLNSNLDWGQDRYYLRQWVQANPPASPLHRHLYLGDRGIDWQFDSAKETAGSDPSASETDKPYYAVSMNVIRGRKRKETGTDVRTFWMACDPVDWAGYSICIFQEDRSTAETDLESDTYAE